MIVALLVLIILILLFGAGVVKGWLLNIGGVILAFVIVAVAVLWLGSYLGENGPVWVLMTGMAALLALAVWAKSPSSPPLPRSKRMEKPKTFHANAPSREERKRIRDTLRTRRKR